MKYLLMFFILTSCNYNKEEGNTVVSLLESEEFNVFKQLFEDEAYLRNINLSTSSIKIGFTDSSHFQEITKSGVAYCQRDTKQIVVNKDSWDNYSEIKKEIVIFHELGHCLLDKDHDNHEHKGEKLSIMHERILNPSFYDEYREHYLDELFTGSSDLLNLIE